MEHPVTTTTRGGSPGAFSKPLPQSKLRNIRGAFSKPLLQYKLEASQVQSQNLFPKRISERTKPQGLSQCSHIFEIAKLRELSHTICDIQKKHI